MEISTEKPRIPKSKNSSQFHLIIHNCHLISPNNQQSSRHIPIPRKSPDPLPRPQPPGESRNPNRKSRYSPRRSSRGFRRFRSWGCNGDPPGGVSELKELATLKFVE
eukprot:593381-Amorphochlora_amoeboformis.AAC.1